MLHRAKAINILSKFEEEAFDDSATDEALMKDRS
jgi:hypothetical protein